MMNLLVAASLWVAGMFGLVAPTFVTPPQPPPPAPAVSPVARAAPPAPPAHAVPARTTTLPPTQGQPVPTTLPTYNGTPCPDCATGNNQPGGTGTYNGQPIPVDPPAYVRMPDGSCAWTGQIEATEEGLHAC